jgi:hypothetical protein
MAMIIGAVTARDFLVPESFGKTGHFRYDSIGEFMEQPIVHGISRACRKCHQEQYEEHEQGRHLWVPCETCHGPLTVHADKQDKTADAAVNRSYELCAACHRPLKARPKDFPQVDFLEHVNEFLAKEGLAPKKKISRKICGLCHSPHNPLSE